MNPELKQLIEDAKKWRYQNKPGFFVCGPYNTDGEFCGYSVGIEPEIPDGIHWKDRAKYGGVNNWITGRGNTLDAAIDDAISKEQTE